MMYMSNVVWKTSPIPIKLKRYKENQQSYLHGFLGMLSTVGERNQLDQTFDELSCAVLDLLTRFPWVLMV